MKFDEMAMFTIFYQEDGILYQVREGKVRMEVSQEQFEQMIGETSSNDNSAHLLYTDNQIRLLLEEWEAEPKRIHLRQLAFFHELTLISDNDFITYLTKYGAA
ncbi:hypothetical protein [Aneurinibacillus tyrosinisolvens]|uniref:hypothetical protein n=1 Tax=Aneurinibacillus tyrosinisolvens TaxID=1443435 RepID=UPI00063FA68B|nr:hypothetical protein [Aneurinibacillus tyrosinisolvens]